MYSPLFAGVKEGGFHALVELDLTGVNTNGTLFLYSGDILPVSCQFLDAASNDTYFEFEQPKNFQLAASPGELNVDMVGVGVFGRPIVVTANKRTRTTIISTPNLLIPNNVSYARIACCFDQSVDFATLNWPTSIL